MKPSNFEAHAKGKNRKGSGTAMLKRILCTLLFIFALFFTTSITTKTAQARCCLCCDQASVSLYHVTTTFTVIAAHKAAFKMLRDELLSKAWWHGGVGLLAKSMATELVANGWAQVAEFGALLDGKVTSETILDIEILNAKSAKRHMPAVSMCKYASLSKSIAQSDMRANMAHDVLNEFSLRRVLGQGETAGATLARDTASRVKTALERHCDQREFGGEMSFVCPNGTNSAGATSKDINYTNTIEIPETINLGFDQPIIAINNDDELGNIVAMKQMLYNHEVAPRVGNKDLQNNHDGNVTRYLKWRGTVAKRTVAENSFDAIVGMKAASGVATNNQYRAQLTSLGMPAADVNAVSKIAPSYWAQMEHLTKTIYQNTDFFVNLYDNPDNVLRQSASMEAISLMQLRDYYESLTRSEMALSILLDTEISKEIDALNNTINQWGY